MCGVPFTVRSLSGQIALVTGASSGIGRAIALALAAEGATVCGLGRNEQRLSALVGSARETGAHVVPFKVDFTQAAAIDDVVDAVTRDFGRLDILVHSAGEHARGTVEESSLEQLDSLYRSNVRAPYRLTQCLLPVLKVAHGQIVFINSSVGLSAPRDAGQFAATQHAIKAVADSLRQEVNGDGIRILNVFLGRVATPRQARIYEKQGWGYEPELLLQPEDVARMVLTAVTLPKTAEVTEIMMRPAIKSY